MNIVIKNRQVAIARLLENHQTLSIMGMPGSGISLLLKELSKSDLGHPVYVDVLGLPELTADALFRALARSLNIDASKPASHAELLQNCLHKLEKLTDTHGKVIVYFAGFDQLAPTLDASLLQGLQSLARSCNGNVKLLFGLCISLKKLIPDNLFDTGFRLFGNVYYLENYSQDELRHYLSLYGPAGWEKTKDLDRKLLLAGGHFQLLLVLLSNQQDISDGRTELVHLVFKNMYDFMLGPQRTILRNIASGNTKIPQDEYLLGIGMVRQTHSGYELFSPLYTSYLENMHSKRLPAKERRLLLVLKRSMGRVVSKQEIKEVVWGDDIVSDWALNALVYRLRKHPAFIAHNYTIESHKKFGYALQKIA